MPKNEILSLLITCNFISNGGDAQIGENILGAIALLDLEKEHSLISSVFRKLGSDSVTITNYSYDYRNTVIGPFDQENVLTQDYILT